jgi:hypothetical protein
MDILSTESLSRKELGGITRPALLHCYIDQAAIEKAKK